MNVRQMAGKRQRMMVVGKQGFYPRVATTVPEAGPYFAADEIGLTELRKQHPEADGRGVRVAVPDGGFDLLHPALQQAKDATGQTVPKIADLGTLTVQDEDSG
jgi:hypothetical protein